MTDVITGTDIIGALLRDYAPLVAIVAAEKIVEARLPADVDGLPVIIVTETSQVERLTLVRGPMVHTTDRVAVTGRFANTRQRKLVMQLVKDACAGRTGSIAGASNVSVQTAGRSPDLNGPADSFQKTQDFRVSYDAPAGE